MNLLILSSSTGGGHNMRANALKYWWEQNGGSAKISQPLESSFILYRMGSNFYNFIQKIYPAFHFIYFNFLEIASLHRYKMLILGATSWFEEIGRFKPDIVVSVHAHLNHGYYELLQERFSNNLKFVIYCGELADGVGFSRHWVNPKVDYFLGPFEETCNAAIKRGMPANKTQVVGPLLRKAFYGEISEQQKRSILSKHDISHNLPIFLLGTGANGVNRHLNVLHSLQKYNSDYQVVALCGKNDKIFNEILKIKDLFKFKIIPLRIIGDEAMALLLQSASFLFARPGAGTTTEAIVCGTPIIFDISRGVMPQEINNLNFWRNRSDSIVLCRNPKIINQLIEPRLPKIKIGIDSSPQVLINRLIEICGCSKR